MRTDSTAPHILCVNPWIHDFAAYDFWSKPLGLLYLASMMRTCGFQVDFMDCLDRFHPRQNPPLKVMWDGRGPFRKVSIDFPEGPAPVKTRFSRYGIEPEWFVEDLNRRERPDMVLVTSLMTYWASGVRETISVIKKVWPDVPVVLGGIYASLCPDHARQFSLADEVVSFGGETVLPGIIQKYTGMDFDPMIMTADLDALPYPAFDLQRKIPYIPILTSRGCPFSCEYCASSFLEPVLRRRSPENVFREIEYWHQTYGVKNIAFYDDALLVNSENYAVPLFEKLISSSVDVWFHTPNALHVREITSKTADLMFRSGFKTIRLGLETTDFSENRPYDHKVVAAEFFQAVQYLKNAGFQREQMGAYLLCGLPGQDLDEVERSVDQVKKAGILPVLAFYTPIPHTKMWEKAVRTSTYDLESHPIFTNNTLFPCMNSEKDIQRISQLKKK